MPRIVAGGGPADHRGPRRAPLPVRRDRDRAEGRRVPVINLVELGGERPRSTGCRTTSPSSAATCTATRRRARGGASRSTRRDVAIVDSHFSDFKEVGADSQAIAGWNGPGPFTHRQQLPGGGGRERDVRRRRSVHRRTSSRRTSRSAGTTSPSRSPGRAGEPGYEGKAWTVKNLLELKNARRVRHRGQPPRGQLAAGAERVRRALHGAEPGRRGAVVDRRGRHVRQQHRPAHASGINILGRDDIRPSQPHAAHHDQEQPVRGRRRPAVGGRRHALSDPERRVPGRHREQHRAARPAASSSPRGRPWRASSSAATSSPTTRTASSAPAPPRGRERSKSISPARSSRAT